MSESSPPRDAIHRAGDAEPPATPGRALRNIIAARDITAFIGVHDAFSATIAGQHFDSIFVSGYGFAASHYGLPDVGFIAWTDMLAFVQRLRGILPRHHILVDLDDGYGDPEIAARVAAMMEAAGASGIVLEDQQRPRRCGHAPGKQVLPLEQYIEKLKRVLAARRDLFVVARTDAADDDERLRRCQAFDAAGADAVLADGIEDLAVLTRISRGVRKPVMFNQIAGGRSPRCTLEQLRAAGVSMVNYSTPCLFAAADAMGAALQTLKANGGLLPDVAQAGLTGVSACTALLQKNLIGRSEPVADSPSISPRPETPAAPTVDARIKSLSPAKQRLLAAMQARTTAAPAALVHRPGVVSAPLSRTQNLFFYVAQLDPASVSLNTTRCLRLSGPVDIERLQAAFARLVARHAILNTCYAFDSVTDEPCQRLTAARAVSLPVTDLSSLSAEHQTAAVSEAIINDARRPFDLVNGPVYRAWLTRLSPAEHLLTVTVHHIAFDGWSVGVLLRDLAAAYASADASSSANALQYADYAAWQQLQDSAAARKAAVEYWTTQLQGTTPIALPADHKRPAVLSSRGARHRLSLPRDVADGLRAFAREHDATLFMVLLAGFKAVLHQLSGSDDLVIGSHLAARERIECESLIGPFITTLVLRTGIVPQAKFTDLLARVRRATLDAMKHAVLPFNELVSIAKVPRDPSRNPLYDIAFQLRNFPRPIESVGDLTLTSIEHDNGIARTDLQLLAEEQSGEIELIFEYCTDLFAAARIQVMAEQLSYVLRAVIARPGAVLSELVLPPAASAAALSASALSPGQERLWFLSQYETDASAYNICLSRRLQGPLDPARLERALNVVIRRHEALRTRFPALDGAAVAEVVPAHLAGVRIGVIEHAGLSADARQAAIREGAARAVAARFNLAEFPLLRAQLLRFAADDHALILTLHHIICDEWSIRILLGELSAAYAADADPLPALPLQYAAVAAKQQAWLAGQEPSVEAAFWAKHLAGAPAVLALPTDHPRPPTQTFRGARVPLELPSDTVHMLRAMGRRAQSTEFMTTMALFYLLLARWSRQRDIVIGTPVANRPHSQEQQLIGYLLNTLPLRVTVPEQGTFGDLLKAVRETALGAFAHQQLPFEKIIEAAKPPRSLGHSPLFQVLFVLRTEGDGELKLSGIDVTPVDHQADGAKFDLSLLLSVAGDQLSGVLEYNTDLFERSTIEAVAQRYVALAHAVCANPDATLATLFMPDEAETQVLLRRFNQPAGAAEGTALDLWAEQVRRAPSAAAVIFGDVTISFADLDSRSSALAGELVRQGVATEDRVGLYLTRSPHAMVALLGIMKAGAAYVPLDPTYPAERLAMIAADAAISLVLTEASLAAAPLISGRRSILLDQSHFSAPDSPLPQVRPQQLAYVLFTSGSTGRPKGVAMPHGPAWHLARWQRAHSACNGGARTLQFTSLNFDVSFQEIFSTWCGGGTLVLIDDLTRRDPDALLKYIVANQIDRLFLPFVALQSLADAAVKPNAPTCTLREVMTAGEQLRVTPSLVKWFSSMPTCKLFNQYGPTETHVINTSIEMEGEPRFWPALPSIGRPIDHSRLYVLDEHLQLLPVGSPGDLYVGGACVARGYLNRPDLTAAAFMADPFSDQPAARMYKTGDLARWTADGTVHYLGRSDEQVKVQGYRVELGEIEDALSRFPGIRQAAVMARDDSTGTKRLIAYVVSDASPDLKALRRHLATTLPAYMVPAAFVRLPEMPLTGSNKINRNALPDPAGRSLEAAGDSRPANSEIETGLLTIWRDVLGQRAIGVNDNFFDIGGQSLLAVRMFARIAQRFGKTLPLSALYASPTIAQLAALLDEKPPAVQDDVVIPLQSAGTRLPLFCLGGIDGHVFNYRPLARLMGADQPVYGLQVEGVDSDQPTMERIEDIAAFLIGHVRRVQPKGPYAFIGYSFGGVVAFEMARQLRLAGEPVRLLAMLDTSATFELPRKSILGRSLVHVKRTAKAGPMKAADYFGRRFREIGRRLSGKYVRPAVVMPSPSPHINAAMSRVRQAGARALRQYTPQAYGGDITLFRALQRPEWHDFLVSRPFNGWESLAAHVNVHPIPGTHAMLLEGAQVEQVAKILRTSMAAAVV